MLDTCRRLIEPVGLAALVPFLVYLRALCIISALAVDTAGSSRLADIDAPFVDDFRFGHALVQSQRDDLGLLWAYQLRPISLSRWGLKGL